VDKECGVVGASGFQRSVVSARQVGEGDGGNSGIYLDKCECLYFQ